MTKQELIDHLKHLEQYTHYSEDAPALREVIEMLKCSEMPNSSDAINRQVAIDALDKRFDSIPMEQTTEILLLRKDLRDLPTAEPKRIRGKWIYGEDSIADGVDGYRCDHCGGFVPWDYTHKSIDYINSYNYCPYCGTDMRGGHDDQRNAR